MNKIDFKTSIINNLNKMTSRKRKRSDSTELNKEPSEILKHKMKSKVRRKLRSKIRFKLPEKANNNTLEEELEALRL